MECTFLKIFSYVGKIGENTLIKTSTTIDLRCESIKHTIRTTYTCNKVTPKITTIRTLRYNFE